METSEWSLANLDRLFSDEDEGKDLFERNKERREKVRSSKNGVDRLHLRVVDEQDSSEDREWEEDEQQPVCCSCKDKWDRWSSVDSFVGVVVDVVVVDTKIDLNNRGNSASRLNRSTDSTDHWRRRRPEWESSRFECTVLDLVDWKYRRVEESTKETKEERRKWWLTELRLSHVVYKYSMNDEKEKDDEISTTNDEERRSNEERMYKSTTKEEERHKRISIEHNQRTRTESNANDIHSLLHLMTKHFDREHTTTKTSAKEIEWRISTTKEYKSSRTTISIDRWNDETFRERRNNVQYSMQWSCKPQPNIIQVLVFERRRKEKRRETYDHGDDVNSNGQLTTDSSEWPPRNDNVNSKDWNGQCVDNVTNRQVND